MKLRFFAAWMCLWSISAPALSQLATDPGLAEPVKGLVMEDLGTGFNPSRGGLVVHGFRVDPQSSAFMGYRRGNWLLGSTISQYDDTLSEPVTALDIGASYGMDLSPRQHLSLEGGVRFDLSSGLGLREPFALAPGATENGLGLRLSWRYSFDRNRFVSTTLGYDQSLGGDALDDSAGDRNTTFGTYFGYRFY